MMFPMMFDPIYLIILLVCAGFSIAAQMKVKGAFNKYSQLRASSGYSGAEAARNMLDGAGLNQVGIERVRGFLSDHYDPIHRVLRLSPDVYDGRSVAALGIACHEAGHAVQHASGYTPLKVRSALVPAMAVSNLSVYVIIIGFFLMAVQPVLGKVVATVGLILFGLIFFFQAVTLPVEFDASNRAKEMLPQMGMISSPNEQKGVNAVLDAAAMTYIAAAAATLLQLAYFAYLIFGQRR